MDVYEDLNINPNLIEKYITKKTKAIMPVHWTGRMCNMQKIKLIAKKHKLFIIEDAAQAMGATYKNKFLVTIGGMGGFSFYGNKIITPGEGGVVFFTHSKLKNKIYSLKNHGSKKN